MMWSCKRQVNVSVVWAAHMCDVVAVIWDRGISTIGKCSAAAEVGSEVCLAWYSLSVPFTS